MGQDFRHGGHDCTDHPTTIGSHIPLSKQLHQAPTFPSTAKSNSSLMFQCLFVLHEQSIRLLERVNMKLIICNCLQSLGAQCGDHSDLCFELLGFDVLLDEKYTPWLLEVNHSPSFSCDTGVDLEVKAAVLTDTLKSLKLTPTARHKFNEEEKRALKNRLYKPKSK